MEENIFKTLSESDPGWIEHEEDQRKTHYFFKEDGDWYISICGEIMPDRDLLNRFEENYQCKAPIENLCKNCLKKYNKLLIGEKTTIKLKSILVPSTY